jgi:hypothetical protein
MLSEAAGHKKTARRLRDPAGHSIASLKEKGEYLSAAAMKDLYKEAMGIA